MKRAAIYSRVDPADRSVMPANRAAAEALCQNLKMSFSHFSDSASGSRPPLQFARAGQLIRPGLTRLLSAVDAGTIDAVIVSATDALATNTDLEEKLQKFLGEHGLIRQELPGAQGFYFSRQS